MEYWNDGKMGYGETYRESLDLELGPKGFSFDLEALDKKVERWVSNFKWIVKIILTWKSKILNNVVHFPFKI